MKMNAENRNVGRHGTSDERQFQIRGSAKAFKILSDGLYSNKILAVVRELSCNAKDAHIDAGKGDVPFEIHLPNALEPWFAVTDYGIGLSHEDVMNLYSTYFESTKTDSNNVTGCLGLGSKSPFAYVDAFTVEARWNGTLTLYSCFYNEEGIPSITVMGDPMDTDEHNGITVKMPVKEQDMREFANNAASALRRFDPAPTVTGNTDYEIKTIEYMIEGTGWKMLKSENPYGESSIHAIQGNVTYPVSRRSMSDLTDNQISVLDLSADIFFDIGELDVAANREALGYDDDTVANIKKKLDLIIKELPPLFQSKFDDCKTLWEARLLFKEVTKELPHSMRSILADKDVGVKWHKQPLDEPFILKSDDYTESIVKFQRGFRGNRGQTVDTGYDNQYKFIASTNILFFYDDVGHGSHSRLSHYMETSDSRDFRNAYLIKTDAKKVLKKYSKALGNVTLQPVSNLPKRPKAERAAQRVTSKVLEYTGHAYDRRDSWNPTELDLKTGGIYVTINRFKVYDNGIEIGDFDSVLDLAKENNIIDMTNKTIYGIRKGDIVKLPADAGWVEFFDYLRDTIKTVVKKEKIASILSNYSAFNNFSFDLEHFTSDFAKATFKKNSPLVPFMDAYAYMKEQSNDRAQAISTVARKIHYTIEDTTPEYDLHVLWEAVDKKYPLIGLLDDQNFRGGYYRSDETAEKNFAALVDYINALDATPKQETPKKRKKRKKRKR